MVRELERKQSTNFPKNAPVANPVFFRTYSRRRDGGRETWEQVRDRCISGLVKLGQLTAEEAQLLNKTMTHLKSLPAGRWLWVGGTQWLEDPKNYSGAYNCTSTNVVDWRAFGLMMDLAMMGCGTGAVLEKQYISQLPAIRNRLKVSLVGEIGTVLPEARQEETTVTVSNPQQVKISIGDSREGWVQSYQALLALSSNEELATEVNVEIDPSHVRPAGEPLKGFGGVANPIKIPDLYPRLAKILNRAQGRKLNAEECCLLIDEAAATVVAGNIRRCLPETALVHTKKGLIPIKDIQVGDLVQTPLGFRKVLDKFDQGIQDVREIETNGTYPQATENHRMAVLSSANGDYVWKRVGELESGDRLLHNTKILAGIPTQLPADETSLRPVQSQTAKEISIPDLTPDVAWLIGFTHGNGYVSLGRNKHDKPYGSITWATDAELAPLIEEKLRLALANFGVSATKPTSEKENTVRFVCSSIRLTEYFFKNIKRPKESIEIPDFILQGSVETRAAYLAGIMDSDGSAKTHPPHRRAFPSPVRRRGVAPQLVCTVDPQFARQIASVLSSLGIAGGIKKTILQKLNWRTKYHVCLPALKGEYNKLIASHAVKGELKVGLKMYSFTLAGEMMREAYTYSEMQQMGFQGNRRVDSNYERDRSDVEMDIPITFKQLGQVFAVQTYDIEVEDAHCFYCDGYLTHNSAGMRQFDSDSPLLKQNLWQPDEEGNWRIDPERDALRMANHTRVYHHKPSLEECVDAVRNQFYSGEGAIQYAPEAIARGNADLLDQPSKRQEFLDLYTRQGAEEAKHWIKKQFPEMPEDEVEHRLQRYGLNPCVTAETWVHTENGAQQVKDLIGTQQSLYVNGELFSTTPEGFFYTGTKPVVKLTTEEGYTLRLTSNHQVLKVTAQTQKQQYTQWVAVEDLKPRDRVMLHNHRDIRPWEGKGTFEEGLEIGWSASNINREVSATVSEEKRLSGGTQLLTLPQPSLNTEQLERGSYNFYRGFLQGLFSAAGTVEDTSQGVCVKLIQEKALPTIQRMLLRLGIASTWFGKELVIAEDNLKVFQDVIGFCVSEKRTVLTNALARKESNLLQERFMTTVKRIEPDGIEAVYDCTVPGVHRFEANGLVAHNCGEIIGSTFHCNLSEIHLNLIDPEDEQEQTEAFQAGALSVAVLLNHKFQEPRYQYSRELDPIVGVSFTGLFDFFVHAFGVDWLRWWEEGRPNTEQGQTFKQQEQAYLQKWRNIVQETVWDYCDRHNIKRPNRCTTVQPSGTKSLLTGASPGWHPPKAVRFIRRVTFGKNDPVALACIDYGYNVIPSQSDKDEQGNLLNDPFDSRCTEWLVEIPVAVPWANLQGADQIDISKFSVLAQFDFAMQVQRHYVTHNTSATLELREHEIEDLGQAIYQAIQNDEGYISAALLARFDAYQTFPRLPFEPVDAATYERLMAEVTQRRKMDDFHAALLKYDQGEQSEAGPTGCDTDQCMFPLQ
jgi:intein/homing endonuclease